MLSERDYFPSLLYSSSELFFCFLHCLYFHHVPFLCEFLLPFIYHIETFNLAVHSLYMGEELKSMHRKGTTCGLKIKGGGELTLPLRECSPFNFVFVFFLEKILSISSLLGRGLRISLFSMQTQKRICSCPPHWFQPDGVPTPLLGVIPQSLEPL